MREFKDSLVVFLLTSLGRMPFSWRRSIGNIIGSILWRLDARSKQVALKNLGLCFPDWSEAQKEQVVRARLKAMSAQALEMANMWVSSGEDNLARVKTVNGEEEVKAALQTHGVILLGPHVGNWECVGLYMSRLHDASLAMYQPPKNQKLGEIIHAGRQGTGVTLVPTDRRGVMQVLKGLRNRQLVGILPDQEPPVGSGVFAPFFGIQALTMTLAANLLRKNDAKVFWVYALPEGDGYSVNFFAAEEGIYSKDTEESVTALNRDVEKIALVQPEMYQWEYKRFKRRPEGEARFY